MGIFTRVRDIISSNINAMLDKAEDPEKMVKLIIREMEDTLVEVKANCAAAMATKKKVKREFDAVVEHAKTWESKAQLAIDKGREDLAREALLEKRRHTDRIELLEEELEHAKALVTQSQEEIMQLEDKLGAAREKQRVLVQRHKQAQVKQRSQNGIRKFDTSDAFHKFEDFNQRIDRMEADADLINFGRKPTIDEAFKSLETDDDLERELTELKARKGDQPAKK
jgi:phage shock protein A